jgi:hypothetical protein
MHEIEEKLILCKDCKEKKSKGESDNESDDISIDMEIDNKEIVVHKFEIKRLKKLGFNKYYFTSEFIQKYKENEGKSDEELIKILKEWKKPIKYNDSDSQESDEKTFIEKDEIIEKIFEELKKLNIETNENKIIRLRNMGFDEINILKKGFFIRF